MHIRISVLLFLLLLTCIKGQAQYGFVLGKDQKSVNIPFEIHSNLVVVPLILNQQLPLKFILDTGVRNAILTEKSYADILDVEYSRKYTIRGAGGEKLVDAYVTNNVTLALPGLDGKGYAMLVLDKDFIELRNFLGTEVHGMLGYEIFSRFVVTVNYQNRILTLTDRKYFKPGSGWVALDLEIEDTKPYVSVPVEYNNGQKELLKLMFDSGASHGLMLDPESDDKVIIPKKTLDANIGRGLGGRIEGQIGRVAEVKFGKYTLENPIVTFPYPDSYMDSLNRTSTFRHGTLGGEIISRFNVTYDYAGGKVYLKKNSAFKRAFFFNMSGITVKALGSKLQDFRVEEVRRGSEAYKSGVRSGDKLVMINGAPTDVMNLKTVNGYFNARPGKRIRLVVTRKGRRKEMSFNLVSPI